jgi:uncharacterized membrane protein YqjE
MTGNDNGADHHASGVFFSPIRTALAALSSAVHTRLELLVTELEEEREHLKQTVALSFLIFSDSASGSYC